MAWESKKGIINLIIKHKGWVSFGPPGYYLESGGWKMQPFIIVVLAACGVTTLSTILSRIAGKQKEMDRWSEEIKHCSDLSSDAEKVGRQDIYTAFQKQGNEALHKYFAALYCEAVIELFPHILTLGIFQRIYSQDVLTFGFSLWPFGTGLGAIGLYIISALLFYFGILKRLKKRLPVLGAAK